MVVAGTLALIADLAAVLTLSQASLLYVRTLVLIAIALVAHVALRRGTVAGSLVAGTVVPILYLAAIESCVTDLMAVGYWASGWGSVSLLSPATPAVGGLTLIAVATLIDRARLARASAGLRMLWPIVAIGAIVGTSVGRAIAPPIVWLLVGAFVGLLALIWTIDLYHALADDRPADGESIWTRDWRWMLAAWAVLASVVLSRWVFQAVPHVPDEVAYWFQAKYLAAGHLWLPPPVDAGAFELPHVANIGGKWYSIFPPGWPAVLALGIATHAATLLNPVLAGLTILVLHPWLRRLYGLATANVACALLALSPMFLLMSAGLMAHPLSAFCFVCAGALVHRAWRTRSIVSAMLAGVALGWLTLTRTYEGMLMCLAFGVYGLTRWRWLRSERLVLVSLAVPIGAVAVGALMLPYQQALTGSALRDPITLYFDTVFYPHSNRLGFGPDIANFGWGTDFMPGHSPLEAVLNAQLDGVLINVELFGWAIGSIAPICLYAMWRRRLFNPEDALFIAIPTVVVIGQGLYWYAGADYGARYWYQVLIPCCVLAAKALSSTSVPMPRMASAALVLSLIGVCIFVPWRAATKYLGYRGMNDSVVRLLRECPMSNGLVLVRDAMGDAPFGVYAAAAVLNRPDFSGSAPVFARAVSADVTRKLEAAFPGRPVWEIAVPRQPMESARIVAGPACTEGTR